MSFRLNSDAALVARLLVAYSTQNQFPVPHDDPRVLRSMLQWSRTSLEFERLPRKYGRFLAHARKALGLPDRADEGAVLLAILEHVNAGNLSTTPDARQYTLEEIRAMIQVRVERRMRVFDLTDECPEAPTNRRAFSDADVVLGWEPDGSFGGVFAGLDLIQVAEHGSLGPDGVAPPRRVPANLMLVELDPETRELEFLEAAVRTLHNRAESDYGRWRNGGRAVEPEDA